MNEKTALTRDAVVEITGRIEPWKIAEIIASGASFEDVLEAHTGAIEQDDLEAETRRRMSGTVARVYDILLAGEPKWPESDRD